MIAKTRDLEGTALDWAVAKAVGEEVVLVRAEMVTGHNSVLLYRSIVGIWSPSGIWSQGGPLIDRYKVGLSFTMSGKACALIAGRGLPFYASKALIAAMRAVVAAELGNEVDVPKELL